MPSTYTSNELKCEVLCLGFLFVSACSSGGGPPFAEIRWQLRCPTGLTGCFADQPAHSIRNLDGEDGHLIRCSVQKIEDQRQRIDFRAFHGADYGIEVTNLVIPKGGGPVMGAGCRIRVDDDSVSYGGLDSGVCGANPPTGPDFPCQIQSVQAGKELSGTILCSSLSAPAAPTTLRRDFSSPDSPGTPASFRFLNCDGL